MFAIAPATVIAADENANELGHTRESSEDSVEVPQVQVQAVQKTIHVHLRGGGAKHDGDAADDDDDAAH